MDGAAPDLTDLTRPTALMQPAIMDMLSNATVLYPGQY